MPPSTTRVVPVMYDAMSLTRKVTAGDEYHHDVHDLSEVVDIKKRYMNKKSYFHRNDRRIQKRIASKYGERERNRVKPRIHEASGKIVDIAVENRGIFVLENVKGLINITRKGDGRGPDY